MDYEIDSNSNVLLMNKLLGIAQPKLNDEGDGVVWVNGTEYYLDTDTESLVESNA
jgi:hypothetical protein